MNRIEACEILEVKIDADENTIKVSYRRLAKIYHPDKNNEKDANSKFAKINSAYEYLTTNTSSSNSQSSSWSKPNYNKDSYNHGFDHKTWSEFEEALRKAQEEIEKDKARQRAKEKQYYGGGDYQKSYDSYEKAYRDDEKNRYESYKRNYKEQTRKNEYEDYYESCETAAKQLKKERKQVLKYDIMSIFLTYNKIYTGYLDPTLAKEQFITHYGNACCLSIEKLYNLMHIDFTGYIGKQNMNKFRDFLENKLTLWSDGDYESITFGLSHNDIQTTFKLNTYIFTILSSCKNKNLEVDIHSDNDDKFKVKIGLK